MKQSSHRDPVPAVVLGLSPTGLYAVRELGAAGVPVLGVSSYRQAGCYSRYLTAGPGLIIEADEQLRLERLMEMFHADRGKPVLIPTSDQDIDFVMRHREPLADRFAFQESYCDGTASTVLTKASFYDACRNNGVDMPALRQAGRDAVASLASELRYPSFVKPSRIHAVKQAMSGQKGWVAKDASEFRRVAANLPPGDTDWLVQEIVPGPESEITLYAAYFDRNSGPHQRFTARKLRQYPPGFGSASLVASHREDETEELTEALLAAIGYRGIAASEFKRDPRDGKLKIIEINPRPSLWFGVSTAAGKRITLAAYHDLAKSGVETEDAKQRQGVGWRYGLKDVYSAVFYATNTGFVLTPPDVRTTGRLAPVVGAVWSARDPVPALGEAWNFAMKVLRRMLPSRAAQVAS